MGKDSAIEWTDHTFNPWWGCEKVSPACFHCYAERDALRYGQRVWGKNAPRRFLTEKYWMQPHKWDIEAKAARVRRRVFCASMADVFEAREDLDVWREKLWRLIDQTSGLDWLLLTKRPENVRRMVPPAWLKDPPANVWYGTTVEDQEHADKRVPELLQIPARIRFLSCEPLLGPVDLDQAVRSTITGSLTHHLTGRGIDWVITGGESGPAARRANPDWYRKLRDQAVAAGVPFFFKQWGEWAPSDAQTEDEDGRYAQVPGGPGVLKWMGKKAAGRLLDGRTWDETPETGKEIRA